MVPPVNATKTEGIALAAVRLLLGFLWLQNVGWKLPPDFSGVATFVRAGVEHPVFPPYSWILEHVIEPNIKLFGWGVLFLELSLAAFLLAGLATRLWATIGVVQSLAIGLSVAAAPNEWGWSYWLMAAAHVAVAASPAAGRVGGLDGVLRQSIANSPYRGARGGRLYLRWLS